MRIRLYGRLADAIGPEIDLSDVAGCSVGEIRRRLAGRYVAASGILERSRALVAKRMAADDQTIGESDELEFLPPVSGG